MDSEFTRSMWNFPLVIHFSFLSSKLSLILNVIFCVFFFCRFRITYRLILREKELHFHIGVFNPSKDITFSFNLLLHTYLKVPDVRRCQISGLHGCTFIDKVRSWNCFVFKINYKSISLITRNMLNIYKPIRRVMVQFIRKDETLSQ